MAGKRSKCDEPPRVRELHTEADKKEELDLMTRPLGGALTAGGFFRLWLRGNPFVVGGNPTVDDIEDFLTECNTEDVGEAMAMLEASFRALDCVNEANRNDLPYKGICPEYLADLVASATKSCPMTWHEATEEISLCTLTHLVLATCRANGAKTGRPKDFTELDRWILERNGIKPPKIKTSRSRGK